MDDPVRHVKTVSMPQPWTADEYRAAMSSIHEDVAAESCPDDDGAIE